MAFPRVYIPLPRVQLKNQRKIKISLFFADGLKTDVGILYWRPSREKNCGRSKLFYINELIPTFDLVYLIYEGCFKIIFHHFVVY